MALSRYFDILFLEGEPAHRGEKLLASVLWRRPPLKRAAGGRRARCRQALRGWRKVKPHGTRLPLPFLVVMMIVNALWQKGLEDLALMVWLMMEVYARPSELLNLRGRDLVPGVRGLGRGLASVSTFTNRACPPRTRSSTRASCWT